MSTSTQPPGGRREAGQADRSLVREAALRAVNRLQSGYRNDVPAAVAAVARLRREAGREPHASPASWGLDDLEALAQLREERDQEGNDITRYLMPQAQRQHEQREECEDRAVHLAVTLWALHQQSLRDKPMHVPGWSLGRAARRLAQEKTETSATPARRTDDEAPSAGVGENGQRAIVEGVSATVRKRFVRLGTSTDINTLGRRLREMVLLLRNARIPLDYGLLADQLYRWQSDVGQAEVRRSWGRDFHRTYRNTVQDNAESTPASPEHTPDFTTDDAGE
ncbi:type I-E CRISPR-associated protein Cse2/CasB [Streptomyces sp. NPDC001130]